MTRSDLKAMSNVGVDLPRGGVELSAAGGARGGDFLSRERKRTDMALLAGRVPDSGQFVECSVVTVLAPRQISVCSS